MRLFLICLLCVLVAGQDELLELLFPSMDPDSPSGSAVPADVKAASRRLQVVKVPYNSSITYPCVPCTTLKYCSVLNGFTVQEVYYPQDKGKRETCKVIETFAERISSSVFGVGKTFRDTPQCREIVMQYLCLYYGSDNEMYTNYCIYQEKTDPVSQVKELSQRAPCHSFCVQVGQICANEPDYYLQTCNRIPCPYPTTKTCTADPVLQGLPLSSNLACKVPYYNNPYFRAAAHSERMEAGRMSKVIAVLGIMVGLMVMWM